MADLDLTCDVLVVRLGNISLHIENCFFIYRFHYKQKTLSPNYFTKHKYRELQNGKNLEWNH